MSEPKGASTPPNVVKDRRAVTGEDASDNLDLTTLDTAYSYRWVQERPSNVVRKRSQGFTFVKRSEGVRTAFQQDDDAGDGLIRHGDRILMKESKARNEQRRRNNLATSEARLKSADAAVKDLARRNNVTLSEGDEDK